MTTREVARLCDTDPATLREFLRTERCVGRGSRYDILPQDVPALRNRFRSWQGVPGLW